MKKDYILTFLTEFIILGSGIWVYRLASQLLGKDGFSEYALIRRTISFLFPILSLGLGVAIPRYIGHNFLNSKKSNTYFIAGFVILFPIIITFSLLINLFQKNFAFLFFRNSKYYYFILPINVMLLGLIFHMLCYSYFRGNLLMVKANILQFINMGIIPPLAFFIKKSLQKIILLNGLFIIIISCVFSIFIMKTLTFNKEEIFSSLKELINYGIQRIPGDFGLSALLSLPSIFAVHISGVRTAGYVAFGSSMVNMVGSIFAPLYLILLPQASQLIASKNFRRLKYYILKILKITIIITFLGVVFFEILADKIIGLYLGNSFADLVLITRIMMGAGLYYPFYVVMRSIIDAYYVKAINTLNISCSLFLFLFFSWIGVVFNKTYIYLIVLFDISIFLLVTLTLIEIWKLIKKHESKND